jgi:hypothetical protein
VIFNTLAMPHDSRRKLDGREQAQANAIVDLAQRGGWDGVNKGQPPQKIDSGAPKPKPKP